MSATFDLTGFAHALGRAQAAWRFAGEELRKASALATVSAAWDIFRRDAGAGDVGRAHETTAAAAKLLFTEDPRRDAVLLWLSDHGAPAIAEAAATIACMVGATRRFAAEDQALLDAAHDSLADRVMVFGPIWNVICGKRETHTSAMYPLELIAGSVERLRSDGGFCEHEGTAVRHALPHGTLSHYVSAEPAGCWALNLALLALANQPAALPQPPGLVSRILFRGDVETDEIAAHLVEGACSAWSGAYNRLVGLEGELARGRGALAHLSRNARTREAWLLVAALGTCTRTQLRRALALSRAGADIQANTLAGAGLAALGAGGNISWARSRTSDLTMLAPLEQGPLANAVSDLEASLAEIDRLLVQTDR